jgi:predicted TIM-barrel fold metal-dependent hydrolase
MPPDVAQHTAFFKMGWSDIDRQLSIMDQCGIEQALLLYPSTDAHLNMGGWSKVCRVYNQAISNVVQEHPDRFVGAGILPIDTQQAIVEELKRVKDSGLKFLSLASSYEGRYLDDEMFVPVLEFSRKENIPIHVHPQIINPIGAERLRDPLLSPVLEYVFDVSVCVGKMMMSGTFQRFSDVRFIFAHYGGVLPFVKERFDNTYQMLRKRNFVKDLGQLPGEYFKNIYVDTSGSKSPASLLCALELVDASHILFGSDFPANQNLMDSIAVIKDASLLPGQRAAILGENLESCLIF